MSLDALERAALSIHEAGEAWVVAKEASDLLDDDTKALLDSFKNSLDDGAQSEAKLTRLAQGSDEYRDHIRGTAIARAKTLRAKLLYDDRCRRVDLLRSALSLERVKIERGITGVGKG